MLPLLTNGSVAPHSIAALNVVPILERLTSDDRVIVRDMAAENLTLIRGLSSPKSAE